VAVKGKTQDVRVYELLGDLQLTGEVQQQVATYQAAFSAYQGRNFGRAVELLTRLAAHDPPSAALLARCRGFQSQPPPAEWNGVFVLHTK
jgi:adenylate cyclase